VAEALQPILDGFKWLGLDWDEGPTDDGVASRGPYGPYFQSQRLDRYQAAVKVLLEKGLAYRDFATLEELKAEREAAEQEKRAFLYSRRWMAETDADAARFAAEGRTQVVRMKMPRDGQCMFQDAVRGLCVFDWDKEQDHVIQRADGTCLYHLASVVVNMTPYPRRAMTCAFMPDGSTFNGIKNVLPDDYYQSLKVGDVLDNEAVNRLIWRRAGLRQPAPA
jgi:glutamyl-tRNA synthetase